MMRKALFLLLLIVVVALTVAYYPRPVEKPVLDGAGPLAVSIAAEFAAPEYHNPLEYWKTHHFETVNRGDLLQADCLYCHEPELSCNNCHDYVGITRIVK